MKVRIRRTKRKVRNASARTRRRVFPGKRRTMRHHKMRAPQTSWLIEAPRIMKFVPSGDVENVAQTSRYMYETAKYFGTWSTNIKSLAHLRSLIENGYGYKDIRFSYRFNEVLSPGDLPNDVDKLIFNDNYSHLIGPGVLPSRLKSLQIPGFYTHPIGPGVLPNTLEELDLGNRYNHHLSPGVLPNSLRYLKVSEFYDQPLTPGSLPEGLHTLVLTVFEIPPPVRGSFPSTLKVLEISGMVELNPGVLPEGLETLFIGDEYYHEIGRGVLPRGLQTLAIGEEFDYPIEQGVLPPNLKYLEFGLHFSQPLMRGVLPEGLETLFFDGRHRTDFYADRVNYEYLVLPKSLRRLIMNGREVSPDGTITRTEVRRKLIDGVIRHLDM